MSPCPGYRTNSADASLLAVRNRVEVEHTRSEKLTQGRLAQREQLKLQLEMERKMVGVVAPGPCVRFALMFRLCRSCTKNTRLGGNNSFSSFKARTQTPHPGHHEWHGRPPHPKVLCLHLRRTCAARVP